MPVPMGLLTPEKRAQFWMKVEKTEGCWLWTASRDRGGYGQFKLRDAGRQILVRAHRISYALLVGDPGDEAVLDHLCRTRHCVRPDHLEPVSAKENTARGERAWELTGLCRNRLHDMTQQGAARVLSSGKRVCAACYEAGYRKRNGDRTWQKV